jgi:hypothetical protein
MLLVLSLALFAQNEAADIAPREPAPTCPWSLGAVELLLADGFPIPLNASFWVRAYQEAELTLYTGGSSIAVDRIELDLTATRGKLIELRPRELLQPDTTYVLRVMPGDFDALFRTGTELDTLPPATPRVTRNAPITNAFEICQTAGVIVEVEDPRMPVIHLLEAPEDGSLFEAYAQSHALAIPSAANTPIRFRVVAIDVAGNRSNPTDDFDLTSGAVPQVTGGVFFDGVEDGGPFGCTCALSGGWAESRLVLALVLIALFCDLASRRRRASR